MMEHTTASDWLIYLVVGLLVVQGVVVQIQLVLLRRDMLWMRAQLDRWGFFGPNRETKSTR